MNAFSRIAAALLAAYVVSGLGCSSQSIKAPKTDLARVEQMRLAMGTVSGSSDSGGAAAVVPMAEPTGWGTLKGNFKMVGAPPQNPTLNVSGDDISICNPNGQAIYSNAIEVAGDGGLKNVLLFVTTDLKPEAPWTHPSVVEATSGEVEFDQKACRFLDHVFAMKAGQPLKVLNSDPTGHNTNLLTKKNLPFNRTVPANGSVNVALDTPETAPFNVKCSIHPWMSAYIMVCPNGYFALTDEQGNFEIPNLPSGVDLELRVWHEKTNFLNDVEINGQPVKKGKFTVNLQPDQTNEISVDLPAAMFN
ncbi:MAG: hypothetical protein AAGF97_06650 [Planctomycetota bacterium]